MAQFTRWRKENKKSKGVAQDGKSACRKDADGEEKAEWMDAPGFSWWEDRLNKVFSRWSILVDVCLRK
jgi:hypothetical protein